MLYFKHLDTLLQKKFDSFQKGSKSQTPTNPYYLPDENIAQILKTTTNFKLPALDFLSEKLELTQFEKEVLVIIFAVEIDPKYSRIYAYLQDDMNKQYPTINFIVSLLSSEHITKKDIMNYFISDSKLTLLELFNYADFPSAYTKFEQRLVLSDSLKSFLLDNFQFDADISDFCRLQTSHIKDSFPQIQIIENIKENKSYIFNIISFSSKDSQQKAQSIATAFGFDLMLVSCEQIPNNLRTKTLLSKLLRDAFLNNALLYFKNFDAFLEVRKDEEEQLFDTLAQLSWISFYETKHLWNPTNVPLQPFFIQIDSQIYSENEQQKQWFQALNEIDKNLAKFLSAPLAYNFKFSSKKIDDISSLLKAKKALGYSLDEKSILAVCRSKVESNLESYAQLLSSINTFKDIVLPTDQKNQMHEIVSHYKNQLTVFEKWDFKKHFQSRGIGVLFSGASGTGKTMAASILANALGLELYRIELSKIVSKYIGETEKNLSKIFETAQESGIILFFDEADAIFGKRSEIKDAHDRYANIEVSYLLQKIEEYDGLVILASNFKNNIDEAFVRRMRFIIDFPLPNESEREIIWRNIFSKDTKTDKINFAFISKNFKLSGANIRNAALYAAFNAVENQQPLNMEHIMNGIKRELHKVGKPLKNKEVEFYKNELNY